MRTFAAALFVLAVLLCSPASAAEPPGELRSVAVDAAEQTRSRFGVTATPAVQLLPTLQRLERDGHDVLAVLQFDELQGFCGPRDMAPPGDQGCELVSSPAQLWVVWRKRPRTCS